MSSKVVNCSSGGLLKPNLSHCVNSAFSGGNRKRSLLGSPSRTDRGPSFELKGEKTECFQSVFTDSNLSMSSLKSRLGPTIQNTLAAAVDTLLSEVALVLNDALTETHQELVTREQENERLKLRLEVSEGELKALQECLSSAQKLIDQLPIPLPNSVTIGQGLATPLQASILANAGVSRNGPQYFSHRNEDEPNMRCMPGCDAELNASFGDTLSGFDSVDEVKVSQLSIQADGTVTNQLLNVSARSSWSDVATTDGSSTEKRSKSGLGLGTGLGTSPTEQGTQARFVIKQEHDHGAVLQGHLGTGAGVSAAPDSEQTAQNVGELGHIHVVEEENSSRSLSQPLQTGNPWQPLSNHPGSPIVHGPRSSAKPYHVTNMNQAPPGGSFLQDGATAAGAAPQSSERPHLCLECGKTFRLISSLKKHIRIHTGEKPYPCPVCGRCFRESGALKTHQRIHTGEKPYSCSDCGTSFRHLDGLRKHRRTHTGEKPYPCGVCGKRLSRLQHLKHHQRIHTGERPCRCPHCHKSFTEPAALRKHLRTHREDPVGTEPGSGGGPGVSDDFRQLQATAISPQMAFGMWGDDGEEGAAVNCVEER